MTSSTTDLFTPTDLVTEETWRIAVEKALKGAAFERLSSKTDDGISISPLYERAVAAYAETGRKAGERWRIVQRVDHPDTQAANEFALADLSNGADGLEIIVAGAANAYGYGLSSPSSEDFKRVLDGVYLDGIRLRLAPGPYGRRVAPALASAVTELGYAPSSTDIEFGLDPIGALATRGDLSDPWDVVAKRVADVVFDLKSQGFKGPFLCADGRPYHNAGASEAQELAAIAATAICYFRALESAGMTLDDAAEAIGFSITVDADQFLGIAKVRALRRLWARITGASGVTASAARVHAETAWRMMTRRDPWVNMLRTTVATFAAGIGGVDSLTVLPCSAALGLADGFARRIGRNTQTMLQDESNLFRVADPAAGSGFVETMTDELTFAAWDLLQTFERQGGIVAALQAGDVQTRIADINATRQHEIGLRKRAITGTNEFPNLYEKSIKLLEVDSLPPFRPHTDSAILVDPLESMRFAEPYESLRDSADAYFADTGQRPSVFLANIGRIADFTTRATWAKNLFEAGGIEAASNEGFDGAAAAAAAFADSGTAIACICSSDDVYADLAGPTAQALKAAGARHVFLAGKPSGSEAMLRSAGVDTFVFSGCAIVDVLHGAQNTLGIAGNDDGNNG